MVPTTRKDRSMIAPESASTSDHTDPLGDLRDLVARCPEALYGDARELAHLLRCCESEVEEARLWILEDGLEVRA